MPINRRARRVALNRARTGSAIRGSKSFRRLMKGMPGAVRAEMADVLTKSGPSVASIVSNRVKSTTKRRTGRLEAGVKWKVFPRTLRLQVGFLGTKTGRAKLFYARILDLGRKAQTVTVNRRKEAGSLLERGRRVSHGSYQLKLKAIRAKRFVTGGMGDLRGTITSRLRGVWDRSLRRVAAGDE